MTASNPNPEQPHARAIPVETLTLLEAARYLNVSDKTLLEMVDSGEVPAAKPVHAQKAEYRVVRTTRHVLLWGF